MLCREKKRQTMSENKRKIFTGKQKAKIAGSGQGHKDDQ
jgi:hypothetical protein